MVWTTRRTLASGRSTPRRRLMVCGLALLAGMVLTARGDELAAARQRIAEVRRAPLTVTVIGAGGAPVAGAALRIEQLASDVRFGCNFFVWGAAGEHEAAYRAAFRELFDYATLPFYWWSFEPEPDAPGPPARVHAIAAWCRQHGITPKGHPLFWNRDEADWIPAEPEPLRRLALDQVAEAVNDFEGAINIWDVVNEPSDFERRGMAPKLTRMWSETGQIELIRLAFERARAANPDATLLINDYITDERYEQVIEALRRPDGTFPFDAIGIQSHMHAGEWSTDRIRDVCRRFGRFGLPLHFTELTILSGKHGWGHDEWPSTPAGEARQAEHVERVYTELFADPNVAAITWWDLSDRWAWRQAPAGLLDKDLQPKPAYQVLQRLVHETWRTEPIKARTGSNGRWRGEVFCGRYRVVATSGELEVTAEFEVHRAPARNAERLVLSGDEQ